jgi:hypothetical protein
MLAFDCKSFNQDYDEEKDILKKFNLHFLTNLFSQITPFLTISENLKLLRASKCFRRLLEDPLIKKMIILRLIYSGDIQYRTFAEKLS